MSANPTPAHAGTAAVATTVASVCPVFLVGGLSVQIAEELAFSPAGLGVIVASYFVASALTSFSSGQFVERFGSAVMGRAALLLAATALAAIGLLATNFWSLAIFLTLAGPANSLGQLASNKLLARKIPPHRRGLMFGMKQAAIPLSTTLAGLAVPTIALTIGWRWGFGLAAVLALAALPLIPDESDAKGTKATPARRRPSAALVVITIAAACGSTAANPIGSFMADYGVSQGGLSETMSGLNLTLGGAVGVAARIGVGWLADRRDGGRLTMIAVMLASGAAGLALLTVPNAWTIPIGTMAGFALGWAWPGLLNFAITLRFSEAPAAATGVTQIGVYLGGGLGPLAFGWLAHVHGYPVAWWCMAGLMLIGAICMIVGRRMMLSPGHAQ